MSNKCLKHKRSNLCDFSYHASSSKLDLILYFMINSDIFHPVKQNVLNTHTLRKEINVNILFTLQDFWLHRYLLNLFLYESLYIDKNIVLKWPLIKIDIITLQFESTFEKFKQNGERLLRHSWCPKRCYGSWRKKGK